MATPKKKKAAAKKKSQPAKPAKKAAVAKSAAPKKRAVAKASKSVLHLVPKKIDWQERLQPLQDRILLIELEPPKETAGGLILLNPETTALTRAEVMAVGVGRTNKKGKLRPIGVSVGDVVLVKSHSGTRIVVEKQDAWIIREEDVLGIETL